MSQNDSFNDRIKEGDGSPPKFLCNQRNPTPCTEQCEGCNVWEKGLRSWGQHTYGMGELRTNDYATALLQAAQELLDGSVRMRVFSFDPDGLPARLAKRIDDHLKTPPINGPSTAGGKAHSDCSLCGASPETAKFCPPQVACPARANDVNAEAMSILVQRAGGELFIPNGPDIKVGTTWAKVEEDGVRFRFAPKETQ